MAASRLTVAQLLPALASGGVEQGTVDLAEGLVAAGHRALVVSAGGHMVDRLRAVGGEHIALDIGAKSPLTLRHVPTLRRLMRDQRIDIVHLRSRLPAWIGLLAWRGLAPHARPRLVSTVHGFYSVNRYSRVMLEGERVICVSRAIRDYVLDNYPDTDERKLSVIHRGIDPARFPHGFTPDPDWVRGFRELHPQIDQCKTLLLPGRITRLKGHAVFLRLVARLRSAGVEVRGFIAGGSDRRRRGYAREISKAIESHGLRGYVHVLGHRGDLRELMALCDLTLSVSTQPESFGRTVLEALSLGRPTVGFAHGGVGEILEMLYPHGIVRALDEDHLYQVTRRLLDAAPRVSGTHPFTNAQMIARILALYEELMASGARS